MKKIAVFASGSGSNAENIARFFESRSDVVISVILTNNPKAFVIDRAKNLNIPYICFDRDMFYNSTKIIDILKCYSVDLVVLAGFLWLIPLELIRAYTNRIVNIHPALLPKYGGKGMYGSHVHEAVCANKEKESGITIHLVNEKYDEGKTLFQTSCSLSDLDTPDTVAHKVHELEYKHFPEQIDRYLKQIFD